MTAVDERIAWLDSPRSRIRAMLVAPNKRRRDTDQPGLFFPVASELPSTYQRDYEQSVVSELVPALLKEHVARPFDVLDAQDGTALIGCHEVCRRYAIPLVHTIHSHEILERIASEPSEELRAALCGTTAFMSVSDHVGRAHLHILGRLPITVPNPVPRGVSPRRPRHPSLPLRALFLGRVEYLKGFDILIDALERLARPSDLAVTVIGSVEDNRFVKRAERSPVVITFTGKIASREVYHCLAEHDMLVFPSRKEACSMALLEAMGTGLAIVCSNIPPNVEIACDVARYHRNGDATDLAARLEELIDSPSMVHALGNNALVRAQQFAPAAVLDRMVTLYLSAAGLAPDASTRPR